MKKERNERGNGEKLFYNIDDIVNYYYYYCFSTG